jgi:hypothetical protein
VGARNDEHGSGSHEGPLLIANERPVGKRNNAGKKGYVEKQRRSFVGESLSP